MLKNRSRFGAAGRSKKLSLILPVAAGHVSHSADHLLGVVTRNLAQIKTHSVAVYFGIAFTLTAWLIASLILRRLFHWQEINKLELVALWWARFRGLFFWVISLQKIGNPIIVIIPAFRGQPGQDGWPGALNSTCVLACRCSCYVSVGATFFVGSRVQHPHR